jgi:zinc and cadmium transporter
MTAVILGLVAACFFVIPSLVTLRNGTLTGPGRSFAIAIAAGILLVLAFGDLFPEALAEAGRGAVVGFIAGFALLFLVETFTHAHTHHAPDEHVQRHSLTPFVLGLGIHNAADGFALGVSTDLSVGSSLAVGFGIIVHQLPVAISLAAVFATANASRRDLLRTSALLGLVIPVAAGLTAALPLPNLNAVGILTGIAAGVLTYMGATHLLPEAQAEHPRPAVGITFIATLAIMVGLLFFVIER